MACGSIGHHALNFEYQPSLYGLFRNEVERPTATVAYKINAWPAGGIAGKPTDEAERAVTISIL
jgi:hypothetical protein